MAAAAGFSFEDIQIGNILSDIGTQGVKSGDMAAIFGSLAESERLKEEQRRKDAQMTLFIAAATVYTTFLIVIIYLIYKQRQA